MELNAQTINVSTEDSSCNGRAVGGSMTPAYGFTLNTQPPAGKLRMLQERRQHLEDTIRQMQDALYIIEYEIMELDKP
jgi:hypothetical protein